METAYTSMGRTQWLLALAPISIALGCAPETFSPCAQGDGSTEFSVRDSAGLAILQTDCEAARRPLGWAVDPVPTLELGGDTDDDQQFHDIRGVVSAPGGGVVVLDRGSRELRYFNSEGRLVTRRGGEGDGPGEFRIPFFVRTAPSDSVLVFDARLNRFTSYSANGTGLPHVMSPSYGRLIPSAIVGDQLLVEHKVLDERVTQPGIYEQDVTYYWVAAPTGERTMLRMYPVERSFTVIDPTNGFPNSHLIPFGVYPSATASRTGAMITSGADFDILDFDTTGALRRVLRVERRRRPVRRGDFLEYQELRILAGRDNEHTSSLFADIPLPDSMRGFTSLQVDERGWLWAELYDYDYRKPSQWLVFGPEGRARGTMELPAGIAVHEIGENYILATWTDTLGIEYVRRYELRRNH